MAVLCATLDAHHLRRCALLHTHEHDGDPAAQAGALGWPATTRIQHLSPVHRWPAHPLALHREPGPFVIGNALLRAVPTPGHTAGCLSFLWRDRLFCGDLLSVDAGPFQPRPAWPEALWDSATRHVFTLPSETLLFCGHASQGRAVSTGFEQRRWHPWLGGTTRDEFLARVRMPSASTHSNQVHKPAPVALVGAWFPRPGGSTDAA